jgi:hypothetical protein
MTLAVNEKVDAFGKPLIEYTTDKRKSPIYVYKAHEPGAFFRIRVEKGPLPKCLEGQYTSLRLAKKAVEEYLRTVKKSDAKRVSDNWEERHKE